MKALTYFSPNAAILAMLPGIATLSHSPYLVLLIRNPFPLPLKPHLNFHQKRNGILSHFLGNSTHTPPTVPQVTPRWRWRRQRTHKRLQHVSLLTLMGQQMPTFQYLIHLPRQGPIMTLLTNSLLYPKWILTWTIPTLSPQAQCFTSQL